jgi:DNA sulfur modification protein DndB
MSNAQPLLHPLIENDSHRNREAKRRKKQFDTTVIDPAAVSEHEQEGWVVERRLANKVRLRRPKDENERLENRFWYLLFRLGYKVLNQGRDFKISISQRGSEALLRQIDVFAKDEETVIVAECRAYTSPKRRTLQREIEDFASVKGAIATAVKKHYGPGQKPKIIWMFVTENLIWSVPDRERAAEQNIHVVTERELRYYLQLAEHLGPAGRFQFLAEFLRNQPVPGLAGRVIPAIRGRLGGRKFYSFIATPRILLKIAFVNHRSLNDPDGAPSYQRLVNRTRMRQIGRFLSDGGFFPTNLLINFSRPARFDIVQHDDHADVAYGQLHLPDRYQSAWVIDGQHRLYGYANLDERFLDENVIVVAFEQLPREEEANLFVTINHEQKSVPKTLLDDLQGELRWGSQVPSERVGAIAARLIGLLNADVGEPFYARVTQQGIPATTRTCLTVPALKDGLRRSGLLGRASVREQTYEPGSFSGKSDAETLDRARSAVNAFFAAIRTNNIAQWELGRDGCVCTNVAVQGYLLLLASLIGYMEANKGLDARQLEPAEIMMEVEEYLEPVLKFISSSGVETIERRFKVPFGSGGPREYYFRLCELVRTVFSDFAPEGLDEWAAEQSDENIKGADLKLKQLNIWVQAYIFHKFKEVYGLDRDAYWHKGIVDKGIKAKAYQKSLDDDDESRLPLENYLDFIEYKKIVEHKQHWPLFKPAFDIALPGEKGYSKNLGWMDRVNELRRISAHPTKERSYRIEDFHFIDFIHEEFRAHLSTEGVTSLSDPQVDDTML